ncbi:MAG: hypothetical protein IKZ87_06740, partial [Actinomycetaceae bacterium]|nr:hypothetical protein [Actinomycetaceae bacterium]
GWNANDWGARGIELSVSSDKITSTDRSFVIVAPASDIARVPTGVAVSLTNSRSELSALYSADSLAEIRVKPTERLENLANSMSMEGVSFFADPHYAFLSHAPQTIKTANANADVLGLLDLQRTDRAQSLTSETFKDGTAPVRVTSLGSARAFEDYRQLGASSFILNSSWCDNAKKHYATPAAHTVLEDSGQSFDVLLSDDESVRVIANAPNSLQARQNALALSAMSYRELPSLIRPQLLYFDLADDEMWKAGSQGEPASGYWQLSTAISALLDAPWVQKAQVADLLNTPASETFTVTEEAKSEHSSLLTSEILTSIDADVAQASIPAHLVEENASVLSPITTASSHLYSQNWQGDSETYNRALENFSRLAHNYGNSVSAVSVSTINLLAEQADIPVHIQNTLPVPATVKVRLDSTDVRLSAKETVTAELPPASTTTVTIPVNAKGSGNVHAKIRLYDSGGTEVGNPVTVKVRVRSGWESTATAVVAIALALMLIIGVVRSVKGGRRSNPVNLSEYTQNRRDADLALADSAEKRDFHRTRKTEPKETPLETRKN